jgi:hypothetical protein
MATVKERLTAYWDARLEDAKTISAPNRLVKRQVNWEIGQQIIRARQHGVTYKVLARSIGLSIDRMRQLEYKAQRVKTPPVEQYLRGGCIAATTEFRRELSGPEIASRLRDVAKRQAEKADEERRRDEWMVEHSELVRRMSHSWADVDGSHNRPDDTTPNDKRERNSLNLCLDDPRNGNMK